MAIALARQGCIVILWDVDEASNLETLKLIKSEEGKAYAYTVDLSATEVIYSTADKVSYNLISCGDKFIFVYLQI